MCLKNNIFKKKSNNLIPKIQVKEMCAKIRI